MNWLAVFDLIRDIGAKSQHKHGRVMGVQAFYTACPFSILVATWRSERVVPIAEDSQSF
jgi:hypothetical protein